MNFTLLVSWIVIAWSLDTYSNRLSPWRASHTFFLLLPLFPHSDFPSTSAQSILQHKLVARKGEDSMSNWFSRDEEDLNSGDEEDDEEVKLSLIEHMYYYTLALHQWPLPRHLPISFFLTVP